MSKKIIFTALLSLFITSQAIAMDPPTIDWGRDLPQSVIEEILERLLDDPKIDYDAVAAFVSTCSKFNYLDPTRKHNANPHARRWAWLINKPIEQKLRAALAKVHVMNEIAHETGNVKEFNTYHRKALWKESNQRRKWILRHHILRNTLAKNSAYARIQNQIMDADPETTVTFAPHSVRNRKKIKLIPPDIDRLKNLKALDLSGCNFKYRRFHQLPLQAAQMTQLEVLNIANSGIKEISNDLRFMSSLETVIIDRDQALLPDVGLVLRRLRNTTNERPVQLNIEFVAPAVLPVVDEYGEDDEA